MNHKIEASYDQNSEWIKNRIRAYALSIWIKYKLFLTFLAIAAIEIIRKCLLPEIK